VFGLIGDLRNLHHHVAYFHDNRITDLHHHPTTNIIEQQSKHQNHNRITTSMSLSSPASPALSTQRTVIEMAQPGVKQPMRMFGTPAHIIKI